MHTHCPEMQTTLFAMSACDGRAGEVIESGDLRGDPRAMTPASETIDEGDLQLYRILICQYNPGAPLLHKYRGECFHRNVLYRAGEHK